jgi:(E)-4-hydroxy-3-methylbut-2-enyl-diphosphate synthase
VPVVLCRHYTENELQQLQIKSAVDLGVLFIDGFGDGIFLQNNGSITVEEINSVAFGILQASRVRVSKTEFISCPSCGRTMFNLQTVVAKVKAGTSHLTGLKIGIMGCIVNGPGEMADADYGYVGAGRGKVSLYKKKECLERNIPEDDAVNKLIDLIKENGDWHEK